MKREDCGICCVYRCEGRESLGSTMRGRKGRERDVRRKERMTGKNQTRIKMISGRKRRRARWRKQNRLSRFTYPIHVQPGDVGEGSTLRMKGRREKRGE
jgi:hypothetical protein